jgi:hypothetical protein
MKGENQEVRIALREVVDRVADRLEADVNTMASMFCEAFSAKGTHDGKTQMSNLERIGLTSKRFGDVVAYVKRQTGKEGKKKRWSKRLKNGKVFGQLMVDFLNKSKKEVDQACEEQSLESHRAQARMLLAGVCLRNMASAYLYKTKISEQSR